MNWTVLKTVVPQGAVGSNPTLSASWEIPLLARPLREYVKESKYNNMADNKVDEYIDRQKSPQKKICQKLRKLIFATFPTMEEEMKWGVSAYGNGRFYIVAFKDYVNLGFSLKGLTNKEADLFDGGGKTMKHLKISSLKEINIKRIVKLLKLIEERHK